jgi:hypothetical protein
VKGEMTDIFLGTNMHTVQWNLLKIVITIVAMMFLLILLWSIADPIYCWCESVGTECKIGDIGWIVSEVIRVITVFIVSFLSGVLFPRDRWLVRLAAIIWLLLLLFYASNTLIYLSSADEDQVISIFIRYWIVPLIFVTMIVLIFSPFFHDYGRGLRSYIQKKKTKG